MALQKAQSLHNEWRGGSAAVQTALARAEHEKALIAAIQLSALKRDATHTEREAEANHKHSVCPSFTSRLASAKITVHPGTCEPLSRQVPPGILFSARERRGEEEKKKMLFQYLPVRSVRPVYTGCC